MKLHFNKEINETLWGALDINNKPMRHTCNQVPESFSSYSELCKQRVKDLTGNLLSNINLNHLVFWPSSFLDSSFMLKFLITLFPYRETLMLLQAAGRHPSFMSVTALDHVVILLQAPVKLKQHMAPLHWGHRGLARVDLSFRTQPHERKLGLNLEQHWPQVAVLQHLIKLSKALLQHLDAVVVIMGWL